MEERVIRKNRPEIKLSQQSEPSDICSLHRIKFAAATKRAEELRNQPDMFGINDSLNCGKLNAAFLKEIWCILDLFFGLNRK